MEIVEEPLNYQMVEEVEMVEDDIQPGFQIMDCPTDIIIRINSCLNINDLFSLSLTCKYLHKFTKAELQRRRRLLCNGQKYLKAETMPKMGTQGRYGHSICYHAPQNRVYVCGGRTDQGAILNDMNYFDLETQRWGKENYSAGYSFHPSKCLYASLCSYKNQLILFGGYHFDNTPATGLCKVFTLDLTIKRWTINFCNTTIKNLHGHTAIMDKEGYMITFGGHTMNNENVGGNEMYSLDCNTSACTMSVVIQNNNRPSPRVFPALAFADPNNLVVVGGQTSIKDNYELLQDAYMFTFLNEQKTEGVWTQIEIEGINLWPTCTPTFAQAGSILYMISEPMDTTHVLVDNELICQLHNSKAANKQFEKETNLKLYCCDALLPRRRHDSNFGITSGRYLSDVSLMGPESRSMLRGQILEGFGLSEAQEALVNNCRQIIGDFYERRQVFLTNDDLQYVLLWLNLGRHSKKCRKYKTGPYKSCCGVCLTQDGCINEVLRKYLQLNGEEFLQQLCAILYHFTGHSQENFMALDYPPIRECNYWKGEQRGNIIPMTDFLHLQSLIPVHRVFFDAPLTTTIYKLDLRNVIKTGKIRLTQDPVRFMAPLFNKYSAMAFTENGLLLCGGVSGEWNNLISNFPSNPRRPSTDTIFIS